ncbi:DUF3606 domain-containing protein [Caulobacter segnis]
MSDDITSTSAQDRSRINVNEPYDVAYWTEALGVSEELLREAVASAGVNADRVRKYFGSDS